MKGNGGLLSALLLMFFWLGACRSKIDPQSADREVRELLRDVPGFNWELSKESRLNETQSGSFPFVPKDDPDSRKITERIQEKSAYADGNTTVLPLGNQWQNSLPLDANGAIELNLENAMSLAMLHSPEFQRQKENLYLSALDVTYERFRLDPNPFAGVTAQADREIDDDEVDVQSRAQVGIRGVAGQGASWVVSLANRLTLELSNGDAKVGGSLANLTITQPLLRGASKRIYRERLTLAERKLLADARRLEQFRQGFFLDVITGSNPSEGIGTSGIPRPSSFSSGVSGYLGLVQEVQRIRNQEANVAKLKDSLAQLEAAFEAGRIGNRLQVDQARQALYNGQSGLLAAKSVYENKLDGYKIFLGLPPDLLLRVEDDYLEHFRLTDPMLVEVQSEINELLQTIRSPGLKIELGFFEGFGEQTIEMKYSIDQSLLGLKEDFEILVDQMPQRKKWYKNLRNRSDLKDLGMGSNAFQDSALDQLVTGLNKTSSRLNEELASHWDQLNNWNEVLPTTPLENARGVLANLLNDLSGVVLELSLARASVRLESIVMIEVSVDPKIAHQTASEARLDWMNARAALVDSWRMTDLARDDLRTDLDLVLSGDLGSDSMGSGHFKSSEGRVSVGIELDTPLSKVRERNRYQASLIQYQQARRQYLAFEDSVLRSLRQHTRLAKLYQLNFELSRAAVRGAIAQVDLARLRLNEPPQPGKNSQFGATTARDLVNALNDLLEASNSFLSVWIGYEAMRMRLTYDLGAMSLSDNGLWEDSGAIISMEPPL